MLCLLVYVMLKVFGFVVASSLELTAEFDGMKDIK